ncbi:MAG: TDP-N-acetylfucosamine:lipid II N-acetylfucosaminyltransferase [Maribacter sp.]
MVDNIDVPLKYSKKNKSNVVVKKESYKSIVEKLNDDAVVFIHNLDEFKSRIVLESSEKIKFIWLFFGVEYFSFFNSDHLYGPISKKYKNQWLKEFLKKRIGPFLLPLNYLTKGKKHPKILIRRAAKKIYYFGIVHEEDYRIVKSRLNPKLKHFKFCYYPLEFLINNLVEYSFEKNNILLGNSSFLSNNHFEALEILSKLNIENMSIITPLSYGDPEYSNEVIKAGKNKFGDSFRPLVDFMSLKEYNNILKTCSIAILNSYRQQAIGNIITLLWMGAKVYLDERNTFYQYLKRKELHVFSVNKDLNERNPLALKPLSKIETEDNRKILMEELSSEVLLNELHNQIESIYCEGSF